ARRLDVTDRQLVVGALQFLQAGDVGLLAPEPFEEPRHARADSVDVERGQFHGSGFSVTRGIGHPGPNPGSARPTRSDGALLSPPWKGGAGGGCAERALLWSHHEPPRSV